MSTLYVAGLSPEQITSALHLDKPFRGQQIFGWIFKGATSFDQMSDLNKGLREKLSLQAALYSCKTDAMLDDKDGSKKIRVILQDGLCVEAVCLCDKKGRKTACLSCQVGCPMGCAFCLTGKIGFARNLMAHEIVEQFLLLEKEAGAISNVVFMGMGEPLLNTAEVQKAILILTDKRGKGLSPRRITLSTCGLVDGIRGLADSGFKARLAVSLTVADQGLREKLMPSAKANPLLQLKEALLYFCEKTGKRITLEAVLLHKVNTDQKSAQSLADFASGLECYVNLIPWNRVEDLPFATPTKQECEVFMRSLERMGVNAHLRLKKGGSICGSCGQLGKTIVDDRMNNMDAAAKMGGNLCDNFS